MAKIENKRLLPRPDVAPAAREFSSYPEGWLGRGVAQGAQRLRPIHAITTGQDVAESLDYAKLPKSLQQRDLSLLGALTANGQPLS